MARQKSRDEIVQSLIDDLVQRQGVSHEQVHGVLQRATNPDLALFSLDTALSQLGPEKALDLFNGKDVNTLTSRYALIEYLVATEQPLYSLEELTYLTDKVIDYLKENKDTLLKQGYTSNAFQPSPWLSFHLTGFYYTKLPFEIIWLTRDQNKSAASQSLYHLSFLEEGETGHPIEGLTSSDCARLKGQRSKLFHLKIAVLKELLRAIQLRGYENLWTNILQLLTNELTADDLEFYRRADALYMKQLRIFQGDILISGDLPAPAVSSLLFVVSHYESELALGRRRQLKEDILSLPAQSHIMIPMPGRDQDSETEEEAIIKTFNPTFSYFQVTGQPWQEAIDSALDRFLQTGAQDDAFQKKFERRLNEALKRKFRKPIEVLLEVEPEHETLVRYYVRNEAQRALHHLREYGTLPPTQIKETNVFRLQGEKWVTRYQNGEVCFFADYVGLKFIALLLQYPREWVHVSQIVNTVKGSAPDLIGTAGTPQTPDELTGDSFDLPSEKIFDREEEREEISRSQRVWEQGLKQVDQEIQDARKRGDLKAEKTARQRKKLLRQQWSAAYGLRGREREPRSPEERDRVNVATQLSRMYEKISGRDPKLALHLKRSILKGYRCSYQPDPDIDWSL